MTDDGEAGMASISVEDDALSHLPGRGQRGHNSAEAGWGPPHCRRGDGVQRRRGACGRLLRPWQRREQADPADGALLPQKSSLPPRRAIRVLTRKMTTRRGGVGLGLISPPSR